VRYVQNSRKKILSGQNRENIVWNRLQVKSSVAALKKQLFDAEFAGKRQEIKKGRCCVNTYSYF